MKKQGCQIHDIVLFLKFFLWFIITCNRKWYSNFRCYFRYSFNKTNIFIVTNKFKNISCCSTRKTFKHLLFFRYTHTWGMILMEWTNPKVVLPLWCKRNIFFNNIHDIRLRTNFINNILRYSRHKIFLP